MELGVVCLGCGLTARGRVSTSGGAAQFCIKPCFSVCCIYHVPDGTPRPGCAFVPEERPMDMDGEQSSQGWAARALQQPLCQ